MNYMAERSLFYYFLMGEIGQADVGVFGTVAAMFGAVPEHISRYRALLGDPVLNELLSIDDIEAYRSYLRGYCREADCFGTSGEESEVLDVKSLALQKARQLFGEGGTKATRRYALSQIYERDRTASVLYALELLRFFPGELVTAYAESILEREFDEGKNSDAGLILLSRREERAAELAAKLKSLSEILLRPDVVKELDNMYGGKDHAGLTAKNTIGF